MDPAECRAAFATALGIAPQDSAVGEPRSDEAGGSRHGFALRPASFGRLQASIQPSKIAYDPFQGFQGPVP
jgi:hypothetical protein